MTSVALMGKQRFCISIYITMACGVAFPYTINHVSLIVLAHGRAA